MANDQCPRLQIFQEDLAPELFYGPELKNAVLHKALENPPFFWMAIAAKQPNFLCDPLFIDQLGADVCTKEQFLLLIRSSHTMKYEGRLRFVCRPAHSAFFLLFDWNSVCAKVDVQPIWHVNTDTSLAPRFLQHLGTKFQCLRESAHSRGNCARGNREGTQDHLGG